MQTRDLYVALLEKRASDGQETALEEVAANRADSGSYLGGMFSQAGNVKSTDSKLVGKLFPGKEEKETGNHLLKVAHALFEQALPQVTLLKTASPMYREVAFRSFVDELEKIGAWVGANSGALHTALDAARKKPETVAGMAQKAMTHLKKPELAQGSVVSKLPTR